MDESDSVRSTAAPIQTQEEATDRLLREAGPEPHQIAERLHAADPGTQTRALGRLQHARGNGFVDVVVGAMAATRRGAARGSGMGAGQTRTTTMTLERRVGDNTSRLAIQREDDGLDQTALELDEGSLGATESIGPPVSSSYALTAASLSDVAAQISVRPEAGHVGWSLDMSHAAPKGPIETVAITAAITLEMPAWTPPPTMLPKARAEWSRWYAALLAHEQGHIDLVHANLDGLAQRMLGQSGAKGKQMFADAKAKLATESRAYDKSTDNGRNMGTVMEVSIEEKEIEEKEAADKKEADKKAATEQPAEGTPAPT